MAVDMEKEVPLQHYAAEDAVMDEDDSALFFQRASQCSRRQRIRTLILFCLSVFLMYAYVLPILPDIAAELRPDFVHPSAKGRMQGRPCQHAKSRVHLNGYMNNVKVAKQEKQAFASEKILDPSGLEKFFERLFLAVPSAENAKQTLKGLTAVTHVAGQKGDYDTAISVMTQWGDLLGAKLPEDPNDAVYDAGSAESTHFMTSTRESRGEEYRSARQNMGENFHPLGDPQVWIDTYSVWLNYPVSSSLSISKSNETTRPYFTAALREDVLSEDPTSADGLPTFHGYSKSGKASGQVVYAALCTKKDFDRLEELGISVKDKITLCRYGGPFRGLKVRMSAERGAVGTLIYSDPQEDSVTSLQGVDTYPKGPARAPSSVQRGSVQAISIYPGDASTPGAPSYRNASRLDPEKADALPAIPSLPISYVDALPFLQAVSGRGKKAEEVGEGWKGAVPGVEDYWTGPSDDIVHMDNQMTDYSEPKDIWNVYAKIPGVVEDEVVVLSNHRDAWTFGAGDPSSGTATMSEVVAGLGALVKKGWRPMRTILVANWDAEEYGLIGSTEAAEDYPHFFKEKAAIFINMDVAVSGSRASSQASPSLVDLIVDAASEIADPSGNGTNIALKTPGPLGSGSDYTAFLQNLGIASMDMGFKEGPQDPVYHYHSNYDSFHWMESFGDPTFARHHAMAQWMGLVAMRSAQRIFLPLNITSYANQLQGYLEKVKKVAPKDVHFGDLEHAIGAVKKQAKIFEKERQKTEEKLKQLLSHPSRSMRSRKMSKLFAQVRSLNKRAKAFETSFLAKDGKGLSRRPFYQHLGVAPGRYLGYGSTTFPGLTESITLDGGKGTQHELRRLVEVLHGTVKALEK